MHILYVTPAYKPAYRYGGPAVSVPATAETLAQKGHQVTVFTTDTNLDDNPDVPRNRPVSVDGVEVWYFERYEFIKKWLPFIPYLARSSGFLYAPQMKRELARLVPQADLVHTQLPFVYPTYAAANAARRCRKPLFYHQRGVLDPEQLQFRGLKKKLYIDKIERPIMQEAAALIALAEAEVASYRALGVQTPCCVIPNGIDIAPYRGQPDPAGIAKWNLPPDATVILFMARLHPRKGAEKLLQAFQQLYARFPKAVLVLAGPDEWGLQEKYRQWVLEAGLSERILFPGMVTGEDKCNLLARADLYCLPASGEGFSMAVLEALASETAVLLSPGCNFPEVVPAGVGRITDPAPDKLAAALAEMLSAPDRLREMGRKSRAFVAANYTWDIVADQLLAVYEQGIRRYRECRDV